MQLLWFCAVFPVAAMPSNIAPNLVSLSFLQKITALNCRGTRSLQRVQVEAPTTAKAYLLCDHGYEGKTAI